MVDADASYGSEHFWEKRYAANCDSFEWYCGYDVLRHDLKAVREGASVLVAGCGSSDVGPKMQEDGYDVLSVDISRVVVAEMKRKYPALAFRQADMTKDGGFQAGSFDCVFDKGLLDSIEASATPAESVRNYLEEIERILKDDGVYICVSGAAPEERLATLHTDHVLPNNLSSLSHAWDVLDVRAIQHQDDQQYCFLYACKKSPRLVRLKQRRCR